MKKLVLLILLFAYGVATAGVSIHFFYCCGKLKTVSLQQPKKHLNCKMKSGKDCCKNKVVTLKMATDQQVKQLLHFAKPQLDVAEPNWHYTQLMPCNYAALHIQGPTYKNPPPFSITDKQSFFCVYRI